MARNNKLTYDGLQLALNESNKINEKLLEQIKVINIMIIMGFIMCLCVAMLLWYYIDSHDLLYYISGR